MKIVSPIILVKLFTTKEPKVIANPNGTVRMALPEEGEAKYSCSAVLNMVIQERGEPHPVETYMFKDVPNPAGRAFDEAAFTIPLMIKDNFDADLVSAVGFPGAILFYFKVPETQEGEVVACSGRDLDQIIREMKKR